MEAGYNTYPKKIEKRVGENEHHQKTAKKSQKT